MKLKELQGVVPYAKVIIEDEDLNVFYYENMDKAIKDYPDNEVIRIVSEVYCKPEIDYWFSHLEIRIAMEAYN